MGGEERVLAVDLGGTHLRVAVVSGSGGILHRQEIPTPHRDPRPDALVELIASVVSGPAGKGVAEAVVGIPGPVNYQAGRMEWAPHLPEAWVPHLAEEALAEAAGVPVAVANDADLAAVGEAYFGAGRGFDDVVYMTVSTGVGAGVVLGGRLVHGTRSLAELGHTVIDWVASGDGRPATLEELCSGTALARLAAEAGVSAETGVAPEGALVQRRAAAGDPQARAVWDVVVAAAVVGLGNAAEVFSPDVIVVGGGVGLSGEAFLSEVREGLVRRPPAGFAIAQGHGRDPVQVVRAELGDDAGLVGAAAWSIAFVRPGPISREPRTDQP